MVSSQTACQLARSLPNVSTKDHFGSDAFYANKRIFATVWHDKNEVNVRLTLPQQQVFLEKDYEAFAEIPNAWGKQGWTTVRLEFIEKALLVEALTAAWESSAIKTSATAKPKETSKAKAKPRRAGK